jgi:hypothetical protein
MCSKTIYLLIQIMTKSKNHRTNPLARSARSGKNFKMKKHETLEIFERFINEGETFSKLEPVTHKFIHTDMKDLLEIESILEDKYHMETDRYKLWNLIELSNQMDLYFLYMDQSTGPQITFRNRFEELYPDE